MTAAAPPENVPAVRRRVASGPDAQREPVVLIKPERRVLRLLGEVAGLVVAIAIPLGLLYRPWGDRWRIPLSYRGDLFAYAASVRSSDWLGTVRPNPSIGTPNGFDMGDFPLGGDRLHFIGVKAIGVVVDDTLAAINLYFLLGFFLIGLASLLVLRNLKVSYMPALVSSVLFAFLPYHFARGLGHFPLATYYAVPVMVLVIVRATAGPLDIDSLNPTRLRQQWRPWLATAALCLLVATSSSYYALFLAMILVAMAIILVVLRRSWHAAIAPLAVTVLTGVFAMLALVPDLLHRRAAGPNSEVGQRFVGESDLYGLRLSRLALPVPDHRVEALADLGAQAYKVGTQAEYGAPLGFLAVGGLVAIAIMGIRALVVRGALTVSGERSAVDDRVASLFLAAGIGFVLSTVGGAGFLIASLGVTQIRAWSRMSVVIGFIAMVGLAIVLDRVRAWTPMRRWRGTPFVALCLAVAVLGLLDQIGTDAVADPDQVESARASDRQHVAAMAAELGAGARVFQLPYSSFPESGPKNSLEDYDHFRGPLNDDVGLRWSYGSMRGRGGDWQRSWVQQPVPEMLAGLAAAGFDAVSVDRAGYRPVPDPMAPTTTEVPLDVPPAEEQEIAAVLGPASGVSSDGRMAWFDLRPLRADLEDRLGADEVDRIGELVSRPIGVQLPGATWAGDGAWTMGTSAAVELRDERGGDGPVELSVVADGPAGSSLTVSWPDGDRTYDLGPGGIDVTIPIEFTDGLARVELSTDAPSTTQPTEIRGDVSLTLHHLQVLDAELVERVEQGALT